MKQEITAKYAIPCAFGFDRDDDEEHFFLTFHTHDEKLAYRLASCVCGEESDKAMVILSKEGEIFHL